MSNVPKLRFPEFEGEWEEKSLGEVVCLDLKPIEKPTDAYIRLRVRSHGKGAFYETVDNPETIEMETLYVVKEDQLLVNITFAWEHAICVTNQEDAGKIVSHRFPTYSFTEGNAPVFYRYFILLPRFKYLLGVASPGGAGRNRVLNKTAFLELLVPVPAAAEQTKIADFLTLVDKIITKQDIKVAALEQYKKGLMQKIFSREIRFKDDNGNDYPEWEKVRLGSIGETYGGLNAKNKDDFGTGDKMYITYLNVFFNSIASKTMIKKVNVGKGEKQNKVKYGDILFTTSSETPNEVGMSSVWLHDIDDVYLNSFCFGYRLIKKETFNLLFLAYSLRSPRTRNIISMLAQGSTRFNMSKGALMKNEIEKPTLPEQTKIANFLSLYDRKIEKEKAKLEQLREQKKSLLQYMFV